MDGLPKIEALDSPDDRPPGEGGESVRVERARARPTLPPAGPDGSRLRKTTVAKQMREQKRAEEAARAAATPPAPPKPQQPADPPGIPMPLLEPRAEKVPEAAATEPRRAEKPRLPKGPPPDTDAKPAPPPPRSRVPKRAPDAKKADAGGRKEPPPPRDRVPKRGQGGPDAAKDGPDPRQRPQQRPQQQQPPKPAPPAPPQPQQSDQKARPRVTLPDNPPRLPPGPPPVRRMRRPTAPRLPSGGPSAPQQAPPQTGGPPREGPPSAGLPSAGPTRPSLPQQPPVPDGAVGRIEPKQVPADQVAGAPNAPQPGGPPQPPAPPPGDDAAVADADGDDPGLEFLPPPPDNYAALSSLREQTDLGTCLIPFLEALAWRGDPRHIAESVPHFINNLDITSFRNVLANLHYESRPVEVSAHEIDSRLMPCIFLPKGKDAMILLDVQPNYIRAFDGGLGEEVEVPREPIRGMAYFFTRIEADELLPAQHKVGWFRAVTERFRGLVYQTLGLTLLLNVLALATPLFVMAVYDKVVATGSMETLAYFAVGVSIAIACDMVLRGIRSRIMAFIGARLDTIVGNAVFHRILFLPPQFTERATVGAQVARIKDFETVRDFFTGPMALTFFELPFTLLFVIVIAVLGGPLAVVPAVMFLMFLLLGAIIQPLLRTSVAKAARGSSRRQELTIETFGNMRAVKYAGAEGTWLQRYRENSAKAALNSFYTAQYSSLIQTISTVLMTASGLGTIVFGVFRVLSGDMTIGALVASMILVWRVLSPLQSAFISMTRVTQVRSSIQQINALMNLRAEREPHALVNPIRRFTGHISFARVSLRYSPEADPALVGVQFDVNPGEVVCVVGGNGSGKSTILKLLAGMYNPQAGSIRIDNQDIRQMDIVELRHAVSYVPQTFQFFYGTIAQNLRLAHPTATDEDLRWAAEKASVLEDILALEQGSGKWKRSGFEVRIGDQGSGSMPTSLLQKLNLARGFLKRAPVMLFDEPGNGLDFEGDQAFMKQIDAMRGYVTVLIVTHRPSHLKLADKIIWLEEGHLRAAGPAAEVRKQLPKDFL